MGSHDISTTVPWCSEDDLRAAFKRIVRDALHEYGHDPYSGSWGTVDGLLIECARSWDDAPAALAYILDRTSKRGPALAVPLATRGLQGAHVARHTALLAKANRLKQERLYPLTEQTVIHGPLYSEPKWRARIESECLARAQAGAARFRRCAGCGSSVAVKHLRTVQCPVCGCPLLLTATDARAIERREARIAAVRKQIEAVEASAAEYATTHGVEVRREWLIGAWAAC